MAKSSAAEAAGKSEHEMQHAEPEHEEIAENTELDDGDVENEASGNEDVEDKDNSELRDPDSEMDSKPAKAKKQLAAEKEKYLRLAAEYDNYRKRSAKEREMIFSDARADTITKFLPVYDNLERALKMECEDEAYYTGIEMIMTGLMDILEGMGVKQIPAVGEPFDPNHHNAVMSVVNPELGEKVIAEEYQKGFMLGNRVIRFSTVVVAN